MFDLVKEHEKWERNGMREQMYVHPYLTPKSMVLEIGAYKGLWISEISKRYDPRIWAFEPVPQFYFEAKSKVAGNNKIVLSPCGVGPFSYDTQIIVNEDASGAYCQEGIPITAQFIGIEEVLGNTFFNDQIKQIDLTQINCEGGEYNILEEVLASGLISAFDHLQIQFHNLFPEAKTRMENIFEKLLVTHKMHYNYDFIFCHWSKL
jgi:FkbM family methyltransferase